MQNNEPKKNRRAGLHKEISSIFKGVPIPGSTPHPQDAAPPNQAGETPTPALSPHQIKSGPVRQLSPKEKVWKSRCLEIWQKIKAKLFKTEPGVNPTRQKTMVILIPVLFLALIFVLIPLFKTPSRKKLERQGTTTEVFTGQGGEINWQTPAPYPTGLRDPMQPGSTTTAGTEGTTTGITRAVRLTVKGIVYSKDSPAAVIDTQLVHEGDKISNVTVTKINKDNVEFKLNGKKWTQKVE